MIKLILLDIDGTMIHAKGAGGVAFGYAFASLFNRPDGAKRLKFAGRTDLSLLHEFLANHRIEPSSALEASFFDIYAHWLAELLPQFEGSVLPGVRQLLQHPKEDPDAPKLGLLTGNSRLGAEIKLRHFGLWEDQWPGAFGDEHAQRSTLAEWAAQRGSKYLGVSLNPEEILVIGDTPNDVACAQSIGARSLAVATGGFTKEALQRSGATWVMDTLASLDPALIRTW